MSRTRMRPLLITQHTCIHVLAVSVYSFDSLPILNFTTPSSTWARWWWLVIIIRYRVSCGVCVDHGVVQVVCCSLRVYMVHEMVQSACWACCWLLTDHNIVPVTAPGNSRVIRKTVQPNSKFRVTVILCCMHALCAYAQVYK